MRNHEHGHHEHNHQEHGDSPTLDELRELLSAESWDERYGASDRVWSGRPNQRLVEQATDLTPGTALDVACGEGGDAIWLARQGWRVTAVDVSEVALERVATHAEEAGVDDHIKLGLYDALANARPAGRHHFDLVTVSFLHVPEPDFVPIYEGIAEAVAPGGRLLVTAHHPFDVDSGARPSHGPGLLFGPERVLAALGADADDSAWLVEVAEVQDREQMTDEGPLAVRDTVVRLRRRT